MKIVLAVINAKYIHSNLAVYSLKAYAKAAVGGEISIAEFTINNYIDDILSALYKEKPDILAFSCYIWNISMVEELIDLMHKTAPWVQIWLGGPEVSFDALDVLKRNPAAKLVMCGEGEETFKELCAAACADGAKDGRLPGAPDSARGCRPAVEPGSTQSRQSVKLSDEALEKIRGIAFRNARGHVICTAPRPAVDMDRIPFPYEDMENFKNKIIYYESSRGCPFSCSYCLSSVDKQLRFRSLLLVKAELGFFLENKVPQVKFVDRTFNCRHDRTMEIWRFIRENDNGITNFHFEITAGLLNEEELEFLHTLRPGLVQLEIGVQSTNEKTIKEIDRNMDFHKLSQIVNRIRQGKNVHQHLDLIAGLPFENLDSFKQSFNDVYALKPQQLQMGFLKVLKGSKMHRVREDYGLIYRTKPAYEVLSTRWLSFDDLLLLKGIEEMIEVYYNSGQFRLSLDYLEHFFETPFLMFWELAKAYERQGLFGQHCSRLKRYDILRQFAADTLTLGKDGFCPEAFDEILLYDMYLRENLKSRPDWARETASLKKEIAAFYSSPYMREKYFKDYDDRTYRQIRNQTHVEVFCFNVPECAVSGLAVALKNPGGVLFDYNYRDALTYEARDVALEEDLNV